MKKLIIIAVVMFTVLTLSGLELYFEDKIYSALKSDLEILQTLVEKNQDDLTRPEVVIAFEKANKSWRKHDKLLFVTTNHNVVRGVNEKFAYLEDFMRANVYPDVLSTLNGLIDTMEYLREEKYPLIGNIF